MPSTPRRPNLGDITVVENRMTRDTWKSSILLGSALCWTMGIIVTAMSLAMTQTNVFHPEVIEFLVPLHQSLMAAVGCGLLISLAALIGCLGASCDYTKFLYCYMFALFGLFLYQMGNGAALIYYGNEIVTLVQYFSIELCLGDFRAKNRTGRATMDHRQRIEEVVTRVAKSMREKNNDMNDDTYPGSIRKIIEKYKKDQYIIKCGPVKDYATPVGALLVFCCIVNAYMGFSTFMLLRAKNKAKHNSLSIIARGTSEHAEMLSVSMRRDNNGAKPRLSLYSSSTGTSLSVQPLTPSSLGTPRDIEAINTVFGRQPGDLRPIVAYHSMSSGVYGTPVAAYDPDEPSPISPVIKGPPNQVSANAVESGERRVFTFDVNVPVVQTSVVPRPRPRPSISQDMSPVKTQTVEHSPVEENKVSPVPSIKIQAPTPKKDVDNSGSDHESMDKSPIKND